MHLSQGQEGMGPVVLRSALPFIIQQLGLCASWQGLCCSCFGTSCWSPAACILLPHRIGCNVHTANSRSTTHYSSSWQTGGAKQLHCRQKLSVAHSYLI